MGVAGRLYGRQSTDWIEGILIHGELQSGLHSNNFVSALRSYEGIFKIQCELRALQPSQQFVFSGSCMSDGSMP
jgi:hypothetical protein